MGKKGRQNSDSNIGNREERDPLRWDRKFKRRKIIKGNNYKV